MRFKSLIPITILNLWFVSSSYAIYGHITHDTTWSDTVFVTGDVVVDSGVKLTVLPGTVVNLLTDSSCWDAGNGWGGLCDIVFYKSRVEMVGNKEDSIVFKGTADTVGARPYFYNWGEIRLIAVICSLAFLNVKGAGCCLNIKDADLVVENSSFSSCQNSCFSTMASDIKVKNSSFTSRHFGIFATKGKLNIQNCRIFNIQGWDDNDSYALGIECYDVTTAFIWRNEIDSCVGGWSRVYGPGIGISCINCDSLIIGENKISNCIGGDGRLDHGDPGSGGSPGFGISIESCNAIISDNAIYACVGGQGSHDGQGIGAFFKSCSSIMLSNNRISDNSSIGVEVVDSKVVIGGYPDKQNDIYNNSRFNLMNQSPNDIIATYNWWGTTDRDTIEKYIFDKADSSALGRVIYDPWADKPLAIEEQKNKVEPVRSNYLQISPNPFSRTTEISSEYSGARSEGNTLKIYDIAGKLVKSFYLSSHQSPFTTLAWDGKDDAGKRLPAGVYFCELNAGTTKVTKKLVLVR